MPTARVVGTEPYDTHLHTGSWKRSGPRTDAADQLSVVITSNLVFSERNHVFSNSMATAVAIDRIAHHSLLTEFGKDVKSVRAVEAARRNSIVLGAPAAAQPAEA
ncbi:MAG: ATP-binding protein [Anaerolineae bacterium]|nr:ATP-binding protein [Anaerolineae bacterium]